MTSGRLSGLAGLIAPALVLAAGSSLAHAQCTGFNIASSTGASIVPGTTDTTNHADDQTTSITLPFAVSLYGTGFTTVNASSNGNLQFASNSNAYTNECLNAPPAQITGVAMFPHWDDLMTNVGGIYTSTSGVTPNRVFNIEWRAGYYPDTTVTLGFEVRLYEDNSHFEFIYGAVPNTGSSATVGVEGPTSAAFNQFECGTGGLSSGLKLTFTPINSSTVLCANGAVTPSGLNNCNGASTLVTVQVTPGTNPPSTGITATANLSGVGGSAAQALFDDGTHGDVTAGDNILSFTANVPGNVPIGPHIINFTCADQQARTGSGSMTLTTNCVTPPNPTTGPDVVTWNITDVPYWGNNGTGTAAYSVGTTSANEGDYPVNWIDANNFTPDYDQTQHPVISQNMYRLKDYGTAPNTYKRLEQLGQSWLKHGFVSTNSGGGPGACNTGAQGPLGANLWRYSTQAYQAVGGDVLSVGCTDTYGGGLNGSQGSLGAKNIVNATYGASAFVRGNGTDPNATINERLQVPLADVTSQPAGTRFFVDAYYVTADDAQFVRPAQTVASNSLNNASWRELSAAGMTPTPGNGVPFAGNTHLHDAGIFAWQAADAAVTLVSADHDDMPNPGTGYRNPDGSAAFPGTTIRSRFWVAAKATSIGGGLYRYEYAIYNHNSDRSGGSFSVPMPAAATVSNVAFHAPLWHSGEPYSNAIWTNSRNGDVLTFATTPFATNQNANALRWGCLYNFGFTCNVAPTTGAATIGLFKPGTAGAPASINANVPVPTVPPQCGSADFNCDGNLGTDSDIESFFACIAGNCPALPCTSNADFNSDGDVGTDGDIEAFFRVLGGGTC
jgi:hypothetical protein